MTDTPAYQPSPTQEFAASLRELDYDAAQRVEVELRAEDPAGQELQIWRTQRKPARPIGGGALVALWDSHTGHAVGVLRRVTNVRSIEKHWVEFVLEPYNPFPLRPDPKSHLIIYLAVPIKWARLHRRTKIIYNVTKEAGHLQNTYTRAPEELPRIQQNTLRVWTTRGRGEGEGEQRA